MGKRSEFDHDISNTAGLTRKQAEVLAIIGQHIKENGFSPSYREIMAAIGAVSTSTVSQLIDALEERGHVKRLNGRSRSIVIIAPNFERDALRHVLSMPCLSATVRNELGGILFEINANEVPTK